MNTAITDITDRIRERSKVQREPYLHWLTRHSNRQPRRFHQGATNFAHVQASASDSEKLILRTGDHAANIGIVTAYNDMLSAHQPFQFYPDKIKQQLLALGHSAQVAGGVPAMCDGITQGQTGMELSLFSRDIIAQATAIALCHDVFDATILLGTCDKIVPGLLMGALRFGYLPTLFVPAGPMPTGISNEDKALQRERFVRGELSHSQLLESEAKAYHSPGTCTFYGTSNTNQMLIEVMGLTLPGSVFVQPQTALRDRLTQAAIEQLVNRLPWQAQPLMLGQQLNEKTWVNALVVLLATGGSTNLSIHLIAMAKMAGITLTWEDMAALSKITPLLAKVYPNGPADINAFHEAGGTALLLTRLLDAGLLHEDVETLMGPSLTPYTQLPQLDSTSALRFLAPPQIFSDVIRSTEQPFAKEGGLILLTGNLGRAISKKSAVAIEHWRISAPAEVFRSQEQALLAFQEGRMNKDAIWVLPYQGPKANGMPELHKLMPCLTSLQKQGFKVALVTDGRLSGASGKVPTALHFCPEAMDNGPIAHIRTGDWVELDLDSGRLEVTYSDNNPRHTEPSSLSAQHTTCLPSASQQPFAQDYSQVWGLGRELFQGARERVTPADQGACTIVFD